MKKHFNKTLIMAEEEQEQFQSTNIRWICENIIDDGDEKSEIIATELENLEAQLTAVVTNLQLTKRIPVIFHNLRGYDI